MIEGIRSVLFQILDIFECYFSLNPQPQYKGEHHISSSVFTRLYDFNLISFWILLNIKSIWNVNIMDQVYMSATQIVYLISLMHFEKVETLALKSYFQKESEMLSNFNYPTNIQIDQWLGQVTPHQTKTLPTIDFICTQALKTNKKLNFFT